MTIVVAMLLVFNALTILAMGVIVFLFMKQIQLLVDKNMSKDYHSYAQSSKKPEPRRPAVTIEPPLENFDRIIG
jgi:flagellar basal body-associated protein FliL